MLTRGICKKNIFLLAGPLRGGRGKGPAIKEKNFFYSFFYFVAITNKRFYFRQLIEIWTYHVKVCRKVFFMGYNNISQKIRLLSAKIGGRKKIVKICFRLFYEKILLKLSPMGGGVALMPGH